MGLFNDKKINRKNFYLIAAFALVIAFGIWITSYSAIDTVVDRTSWSDPELKLADSKKLSPFSSAPALVVRDCILAAAKVEALISEYDQLDRDFLVIYASGLSYEEFERTAKGTKRYSEDLTPADIRRLLVEAQFNKECRIE
jgi:hypothetical protein